MGVPPARSACCAEPHVPMRQYRTIRLPGRKHCEPSRQACERHRLCIVEFGNHEPGSVMLGLRKKKPVHDHEATGELERVYHEIKQILRVSGINLNFRTWAAHGGFLPIMWDSLRDNLETRPFETAADEIRAEAVRMAGELGPIDAASAVPLGQSQSYHILSALDLYHYINPKLLVLTSAVALSLEGEEVGLESTEPPERIVRGVPSTMFPMEMESDHPDNDQVRQLYRDICATLSLPSVNSDYRTLALWPNYLAAAWARLEPLVRTRQYIECTNNLREDSRAMARALPYPVGLSVDSVRASGADPDEVAQVTRSFEQLLPGLIIHIALLQRDWRPDADLTVSPFPVDNRSHTLRGLP